MAADENSSAINQGQSAQDGAQSQPVGETMRKPRPMSMDTQSLKALAPDNEVARSALEMRQNLEKFMPAGPQRDQLIAQLKEDVAPILQPELEAKQAGGHLSEQAPNEQDRLLNEAIDRAARQIKDKLGQFENFGPVKEVTSIPAAVIDHLRAVLYDNRRGQGEFQIAIGQKDGKHFSSSRYFELSPDETFAYDRKTAEGLTDLKMSGYQVEALIHVHQQGGTMEPSHFSIADTEQADALQSGSPGVSIRSFLLTPAPDNILIVYSPATKDSFPLGEAIGVFLEDGNLDVRSEKYNQLFAESL